MWKDKLKEIIYILENSNVNEIDFPKNCSVRRLLILQVHVFLEILNFWHFNTQPKECAGPRSPERYRSAAAAGPGCVAVPAVASAAGSAAGCSYKCPFRGSGNFMD